MKICILGQTINTISGHSKPAFDLAERLGKKGNEITIITNKSAVGIDFIRKQLGEKNYSLILAEKSLKRDLYFRKDRDINDVLNNSEIIHLFDYIPPNLLKKITKKSTPIISNINSIPKLNFSDLYDAGLPSLLNLPNPSFIKQMLTPGIFYKRSLDGFTRIFSSSNYVSQKLIDLGVSTGKIELMPTWLDKKLFDTISDNDQLSVPNFVYFGWGSSIRGLPDVINAFKFVTNTGVTAKLTVCLTGYHGVEEKYYRYLLTNDSSLRNVELMVGYNPNIFGIVKSAVAVVLPFRSPFGYAQPPLVVIEAMALERPVISTYVGSVPEVLSDGKTGFLVQPRDVKALAEKMLLVLNEKELSRRIGIQAREYVLKNHNLDITVDIIIKSYNKLLSD